MKKVEWHWENFQLIADKGAELKLDDVFPLPERVFHQIRHTRYIEILKLIGKYHIKIPKYTRLKIRRK